MLAAAIIIATTLASENTHRFFGAGDWLPTTSSSNYTPGSVGFDPRGKALTARYAAGGASVFGGVYERMMALSECDYVSGTAWQEGIWGPNVYTERTFKFVEPSHSSRTIERSLFYRNDIERFRSFVLNHWYNTYAYNWKSGLGYSYRRVWSTTAPWVDGVTADGTFPVFDWTAAPYDKDYSQVLCFDDLQEWAYGGIHTHDTMPSQHILDALFSAGGVGFGEERTGVAGWDKFAMHGLIYDFPAFVYGSTNDAHTCRWSDPQIGALTNATPSRVSADTLSAIAQCASLMDRTYQVAAMPSTMTRVMEYSSFTHSAVVPCYKKASFTVSYGGGVTISGEEPWRWQAMQDGGYTQTTHSAESSSDIVRMRFGNPGSDVGTNPHLESIGEEEQPWDGTETFCLSDGIFDDVVATCRPTNWVAFIGSYEASPGPWVVSFWTMTDTYPGYVWQGEAMYPSGSNDARIVSNISWTRSYDYHRTTGFYSTASADPAMAVWQPPSRTMAFTNAYANFVGGCAEREDSWEEGTFTPRPLTRSDTDWVGYMAGQPTEYHNSDELLNLILGGVKAVSSKQIADLEIFAGSNPTNAPYFIPIQASDFDEAKANYAISSAEIKATYYTNIVYGIGRETEGGGWEFTITNGSQFATCAIMWIKIKDNNVGQYFDPDPVPSWSSDGKAAAWTRVDWKFNNLSRTDAFVDPDPPVSYAVTFTCPGAEYGIPTNMVVDAGYSLAEPTNVPYTTAAGSVFAGWTTNFPVTVNADTVIAGQMTTPSGTIEPTIDRNGDGWYVTASGSIAPNFNRWRTTDITVVNGGAFVATLPFVYSVGADGAFSGNVQFSSSQIAEGDDIYVSVGLSAELGGSTYSLGGTATWIQ